MKIKPNDLPAAGYVLLDQLGHQELVPFIRRYLKMRNRYSMLYYLSNIIVFAFTGYFFVQDIHAPGHDLGDRFTHFAYGLAIAFALLPLHEYIHVLAYRSQGAISTSYAANLKKFYFMALADKFVANQKEFEIIALAPFVILTTLLIILLCVLPFPWSLTILGILMTHTAMCSGDFGLLSYFAFNKEREVVTYDDKENNLTYFYGRTEKSTTPA